MFTGLVEETGVVRGLKQHGEGFLLELEAITVLEGTRIGDSICINGACQTVTELKQNSFVVFMSRVTAAVTTLGSFKPGRVVNLERAMTPSSRFGGHIVQGHVDGMARVTYISRDVSGMDIRLETSPEIMHYVVVKGSVTVDGISLTVVSADEKGFSLYLIPETMEKTVILQWKKGDSVNIEVDILAKYVEKMVKNTALDEGQQRDESLKKALAEGGFFS